MAFCNMCGTQIPDGAMTCAACAGRVPPNPVASAATAQGLTDNVAGLLAYITIIPAIIFLVMEPYNKSRFIRFHSFQCIFVFVAAIICHIALGVVAVIPFLVLLTLPLHALLTLATFCLLIFLALKANQGQMYKLPVIGDLAEKQANSM